MKAAPRSRRDRIRAQLADLKMPGALEALDEVLTRVDGGGVTASEAIEQLMGAQISLRNNRQLEAAMRSSRLPAIKTLEDFDFSFQPSIKREQLDSLHELGFLARKENVIFLGPPGVGKTHLAISLAIAAAQSGRRVYYGALADLITSLEEAKAAGRLSHRLKTLTYPSLLVVDEIGYLPVSPTGALSANVRETRSTQRIRVGRRQRKRTCWDCEREWKRMVVPLEPGRPSEARQLLADPEVVDRPLRRRFSPSYKLRIVEKADRCTEPGEVGQLLRREGLYSSHLTTWRKAAHSGSLKALSKKRGRKPERNPLDEKVRKLERRNARLENELRKAHLIIDVQGKVAGLLGISLDDGTNS